MSLDRLSKKDLELLAESPIQLRRYCLENHIGIIEALAKIKSLIDSDAGFKKEAANRLKKPARDRDYFLPSAVDTPEGVVTTVLRHLQAERFTGKEYSLQHIVNLVEGGIERNEIEVDPVTPLRGFVAEELYEQVRSLLPRSRAATASNGHIGIVDVRRRLRLDLDRASKEEILGVVDPEKLRKNYAYENGTIVYNWAPTDKRKFSRLEGTTCWDSKEKDAIRTQLASFVKNHLFSDAVDNFSYLGLEGPRFGSFLPLAHEGSQHGKRFNGTFVEYDSRSYNLMQSVRDAGLTGLLDNSTILFGDIDDRILLDFAQDPDLSVVRRDNGEANALYVKYHTRKGPEFLSLDKYQQLISESSTDVKSLARRYGVSDRFINASKNRSQGKFDVVFLDYVGTITDKRRRAFESLVKSRLSNRAVVAATINVAPRINPLKTAGSIATLPNAVFDQIVDSASVAGYRGKDVVYRTYSEGAGTDKMCFQAYYLER